MKKTIIITALSFLILITTATMSSAFEIQINNQSGGATCPTTTWINGEKNIALYSNGGRIVTKNSYNVNATEILKNYCIDGNKNTAVKTMDAFWNDAQIEIDLADEYHYLYQITIIFKLWGQNSGHIEIKVHDKDQGWKTVYNDESITTGNIIQTKNIVEGVQGYYVNKIRFIAHDTELYNIPKYWIYEIQAIKGYKDESEPSIIFDRPDPNHPYLYLINQKIMSVPLDYSIMVLSDIELTINDDIFIKEYSILLNGIPIESKTFSINDERSQVEKNIFVPNGKNTFKIIVKDFANNEVSKSIKVHGFGNSPPCLLSKPIGPESGKTRTPYTFSISAIDPENDPIEYGWDWNNDGNVDEWSTSNSVSHIWNTAGEYTITVSLREQNTGRLGLWTTSKSISIQRRLTSDQISSATTSTMIPTTPSSTPSVNIINTFPSQTTTHPTNNNDIIMIHSPLNN